MTIDVADGDMVKLFMDAGYSRADAEEAAAAATAEDIAENAATSIGRLIALDQVIDRSKGEKFDTSLFGEQEQCGSRKFRSGISRQDC